MADFKSQLNNFIREIESIPDDVTKAVQSLGDELKDELIKTHRNESDPYGNPWASRKIDKPWPVLNKSGNLLSSYAYRDSSQGVSLYNKAAYASYQQNKRPLLPSVNIPDEWMKLIQEAIDELIKDKFGQ